MPTQPPVHERFSREQVLQVLGITERQLKTWERQGLVPAAGLGQPSYPGGSSAELPSPESRPGGATARTYSFSDLATMRTILRLRQKGVPPARILSVRAALESTVVPGESPWSQVQVEADGKRLAVNFQGTLFEPLSGQLLLNYVSPREVSKVREFERPVASNKAREAELRLRAERLFLAGLRYEESEETLPRAIRAYQKAIELNPRAVGAYINLGTIYYNAGQLDAAEQCYRAALTLEPHYALAHFNMANVFDERGELEKAREHYEEALRLNPNYPDPHYNLALAYDKLGLHGKARQQWLAYLKLDPYSHWATFARQQLAKTELPVLSGESIFKRSS